MFSPFMQSYWTKSASVFCALVLLHYTKKEIQLPVRRSALLEGENVSRLISNGAFICRWSVGAECFTNIRSAEGKLLQNI